MEKAAHRSEEHDDRLLCDGHFRRYRDGFLVLRRENDDDIQILYYSEHWQACLPSILQCGKISTF